MLKSETCTFFKLVRNTYSGKLFTRGKALSDDFTKLLRNEAASPWDAFSHSCSSYSTASRSCRRRNNSRSCLKNSIQFTNTFFRLWSSSRRRFSSCCFSYRRRSSSCSWRFARSSASSRYLASRCLLLPKCFSVCWRRKRAITASLIRFELDLLALADLLVKLMGAIWRETCPPTFSGGAT